MLNFFQEDTLVNPIQEVEPLVEEKTLSLMDLLFSGGTAGTIIIIVLFILLFVAVYIFILNVCLPLKLPQTQTAILCIR